MYWYPNHGAIQAITFFGDLPKIKKKYGILKYFLAQDHMQLEVSKCSFSHNFRWSQSKLYKNIGYHGKSKYLLEHCNEKLESRTLRQYILAV